MRRILAIFALLALTLPLAAFDFSVSPNSDGSFDFHLRHDWLYGDGPFFSTLSLDSSSGSSTEKKAGQRIMSVSRDFTAAMAPLGFKLSSGGSELRGSFDLGWQRMNISELGYSDATIDSVDYRFFLANDRIIDLILPKLRFDSRFAAGPLFFNLGGEYSPWLSVKLDQTLSTSATPAYPSPLPTDKNNVSTQSAYNAFSLDGSVFIKSAFLEPGIEAVYDDLAIKYGYIDAFGDAVTLNTRNGTLSVGGSVVLRFVSIVGLSPKLSFSLVKDWTDDLSDSDPAVASEGEWKFFVGFVK